LCLSSSSSLVDEFSEGENGTSTNAGYGAPFSSPKITFFV
jgi:hypothetical protein